MSNEYQKILSKVINNAKDEVEWKSRVFTAIWYNGLFENDCLRSAIRFYCYGDCIPHGFVLVDKIHEKVKAYDANMSLLKIWNIE